MQLSIQTDSKKLSDNLTALIEKARRVEKSTTWHEKYFFFKCKSDLVEALYWCAITASEHNVWLFTTRATESISWDTEHIIRIGNTFRRSKFETTFYFDDNNFIYND